MLDQEFEPADEEITLGGTTALVFQPRQMFEENEMRGVVLFTDIFGNKNEDNQRVSRFLANEGFLTIVPDLFRKNYWNPGDDMTGLNEWRKTHPRDRVLQDVQAAVAYLRGGGGGGGCARVGAVGFCWGGELALHCSTHENIFDTVIGFYPTQMNPEEGAGVKIPALFVFGQQDTHIPMNQVEALSAAARCCPRALAIRVYAQCAHGFAHREAAAAEEEKEGGGGGGGGGGGAAQLARRAAAAVRREAAAWLRVHLDHVPALGPVAPGEWWPEGRGPGPGRQFRNPSLERWEALRLRWRVPVVPRPPAPPPVEYDAVVDGLSARVRTFTLPARMKLGDLVEMFNDVWELENGY